MMLYCYYIKMIDDGYRGGKVRGTREAGGEV